MLGSLYQFIQTQQPRSHTFHSCSTPSHLQHPKLQLITESFTPDDKSSILDTFNRKSLQIATMRQYSTLSKNTNPLSSSTGKRTSIKNNYRMDGNPFFAKIILDKDYISKQNLTKDHSLLKAILRSREADTIRKDNTCFDECLSNLKSSFKNPNHNHTTILPSQPVQEHSSNIKRKITYPSKIYKYKNRQSLKVKKLQLNNCRKWADKHKKPAVSFSKLFDFDWETESKAKTDQMRQLWEKRKKMLDKIDEKVGCYSFII